VHVRKETCTLVEKDLHTYKWVTSWFERLWANICFITATYLSTKKCTYKERDLYKEREEGHESYVDNIEDYRCSINMIRNIEQYRCSILQYRQGKRRGSHTIEMLDIWVTHHIYISHTCVCDTYVWYGKEREEGLIQYRCYIYESRIIHTYHIRMYVIRMYDTYVYVYMMRDSYI